MTIHPGQQHEKLMLMMNLRRQGRRSFHPLVIGTAALSLLATALPSYAFAASMGSSNDIISPSSVVGVRSSPSSHRLLLLQQQKQHQQKRIISSTGTMMTKRHHRRPLFALRGGQSSSDRPIKKVTVVGGTHGNEYTGIWVIKSIDKQREIYQQNQGFPHDNSADASTMDTMDNTRNIFERFPSLEIDTLLANPVAYMENKRFVDVDLNREFSVEKLRKVPIKSVVDDNSNIMEECDVRTEFCSDGNNADVAEVFASLPHESVRAREIEGLLGPKFTTPTEQPSPINYDDGSSSSCNNVDPNTCVVIDLHTTTSNMGITLIIPEGDALMSAAAAYVLHKCQERYGSHEAQCLMHALPQRQDRMNLSSCGRHGFTIEVGPTPQGVLRHDVVEKTETALHALLEFLHLRNLDQKNDDETSPSVLRQLQRIYPDGIVPCYRSAPAVRPGELSGKIAWPNDESNPNFPKRMIHKSVQDRDFEPLRIGDPLFVELDGTIVPYDGSHGDEVYLIFVNEGGYYYASSGTGVGVAVRSQFDLQTGELSNSRAMNSIRQTTPVIICSQCVFDSGWFVVESDGEESAMEEVVVVVKDSYE